MDAHHLVIDPAFCGIAPTLARMGIRDEVEPRGRRESGAHRANQLGGNRRTCETVMAVEAGVVEGCGRHNVAP